MEKAVKMNRLLLKFLVLRHADIQENVSEYNVKLNFPGTTWEQQLALEKTSVFWLLKSQKYKIFPQVDTIVPLPRYAGFIISLPF